MSVTLTVQEPNKIVFIFGSLGDIQDIELIKDFCKALQINYFCTNKQIEEKYPSQWQN